MSSEELFERSEVSGLRGVDESVDESLLFGGADLPARFAGEVDAGAADELLGVCLARHEHICDLPVRVGSRTLHGARSRLVRWETASP
jgi:hypothetical protein